jgi:NAD(P)-dependent dehydrogenase (short-subunit alcohol dehydrogenase family)
VSACKVARGRALGTYLIYGGNGGIGLAIARALAEDGHRLHLVGRDGDRLSEVAAELGAGHSVADVTDPDQIARAAGEAGDDLAGLVYAVGTINLKPLGRMTGDDFLTDFRVNAAGAALAVQASLDALKAGEGGSVLLFSSVAVSQGFAAHASVSMAKGAVEGLTRALAAELAPKVRVNAIAPSLTATPLAASMTASEQMAKAIAGMHAIPRLGSAEDHAALARVLLTDAGGWITGQVIGVDGGRSSLRTKG